MNVEGDFPTLEDRHFFRIEEVGSGPVRFVVTTSETTLTTAWVTL